jgi:mono/diheme cytochrome c family protein
MRPWVLRAWLLRTWLAAGALLLLLSLPLLASSKEQRQHGAALFASSGCQTCHTIGSVGGKRGPDLSGIGRRAKDPVIRNQIINGSKVMPAYGNVLAPQEIDDLIAYLHSCRQKIANQKPAN